MSRGASALSCLAKTVFNLKGRIDLGEPAEISCVKRKNGHNFSASFRLNTETRWFEPSETASSPQRKPANYDLIVAWIRENAPPGKPVKTGDIVAAFAAISRNTLMQNLRSAVDKGDISSPRRGFYCASPPPDEVL
jgi:hypothetical protein